MVDDIDQYILQRFEIIQKVKKTNSGIVWKAIDRKINDVVALKKVIPSNVGSTELLKLYRDILILLETKDHPNIVGLKSVIRKKNQELYLISDFVDMDLFSLIRAQILEDKHRKVLFYNIANALSYIHAGKNLHCDLCPHKILVDSECQIKILGFGLAQNIYLKNPHLNELTQQRWYKAPEVLLGSKKLTQAIDIWSLGCIFAEMHLGNVLFAGSSTLNQLERIVELIGKPPSDDISDFQSEVAGHILSAIQLEKKKSISSMFSNCSQQALDLLKKMLNFNPRGRISINEILAHDYLTEFSNRRIGESKVEGMIIHYPEDQLDNRLLTLKEYQEILFTRLQKRSKKSIHQSEEEVAISDQVKETFEITNPQSVKKMMDQNRKQSMLLNLPFPFQRNVKDSIISPTIIPSQNQTGKLRQPNRMTQINDTPLQRTPPAVFDYEDDLRSVHVKKKHSMIVPLENKIKQIQRKQ